MRTMPLKIIARAGLEPWEKLFQNLRATRETELAEIYPMHVVCAWIGNSPAVAAKHYLQVTDAHFAEAAQNPAQHLHAGGGTESQDKNPANAKIPVLQGLELPPQTSGKTPLSQTGGTESDPHPDIRRRPVGSLISQQTPNSTTPA
jgi:hypothetical protein